MHNQSDQPQVTFSSELGLADPDHIWVLGKDLSTELMGHVSFGELAYWLIARQKPTPGQLAVFEAVLVALAEHGFTPSAISTRLTLLGAPESIQGAIAAGVLGGGSHFLGVTENTGRMLSETLTKANRLPESDQGWDALADERLRGAKEAGARIPGLGHGVHRQADPRVAALVRIAADSDCFGPHLSLFVAMGRRVERSFGRRLPLNGAGACGAALLDIGIPLEILRGVAVLARVAGLVGHLSEEMVRPVAQAIYSDVETRTDYLPHSGEGS